MSSKGVSQLKKSDEGEDKGVFEDAYSGLQQRMGRMFEKLMDMTLERQAKVGSFVPRVDLVETDGIIKLTAELPGLNEKDIEITLNPDSLFLKGEKKVETEENQQGVRHIERSYGSFFRRIELPAEVDPEKVDAIFSKGVLHVTLHKAKESKAKKVKLRPEG